jgi:FlaA1/EpsC-like NDP-sugar epimerase
MVLEMGDQVKIVEVAKTLTHLSGRKGVDFVYTGLRPGEKLQGWCPITSLVVSHVHTQP